MVGPSLAVASADDCIRALREAADRLGESPTKADYEELGLTPASATIQRVMGSWNEVKEAAGLATNASSRNPRLGQRYQGDCWLCSMSGGRPGLSRLPPRRRRREGTSGNHDDIVWARSRQNTRRDGEMRSHLC
ncbi:homing endonuclease associated repeat-containing protein [Haloarcula salinisoli]|uniref:homing endonuclease associated repeat-containing protein n=1 Tax=Haloarcula salinisoli TaxID=2487746 RepID=UPI001F25AC56|nr:hypothetical protein [Halomicroarcula salinisoli]